MLSRSRNVPRSRWHGEEWLSRVAPCDYLRADERRLNGARAPFQTAAVEPRGWVEMRHCRFVRSGEVHPSKAVINGPKP
jgi:hypothetical protein